MDTTDHEPEHPGGRAEDRRRQFENSRGLSGRRRELPLDDEELPLDDESAADEPDADEPDAEEQLDDDEDDV